MESGKFLSEFCIAHRAVLTSLKASYSHFIIAFIAEAYSAFWAAKGGSDFAACVARFPVAFVTQ
jgi:hypothetical protein